jgi:hypothetical protein
MGLPLPDNYVLLLRTRGHQQRREKREESMIYKGMHGGIASPESERRLIARVTQVGILFEEFRALTCQLRGLSHCQAASRSRRSLAT